MMDNDSQTCGDELLARVLTGDEWESGIANDLLNEFFRGYSIENLVTVLSSDNEKVVQSGAWIASELARDAKPILIHLLPLFTYPNINVRCSTVETVLTAATNEDGEVIGSAVSLITDRKRPVRRVAFELMTRAGSPLLAAGVPHIKDPEIATLLEWVLEVERGSRNRDEIASRLQKSDAYDQLFAVIAAARIHASHPEYLQSATSLPEGDARSFAASELQWLIKLQEQTQRRRERRERRRG